MANIALKCSSAASDELRQQFIEVVSEQVVDAKIAQVRPDPAKPAVLLVHIPDSTLQRSLNDVAHETDHAVHTANVNVTARSTKHSSSTTAAADAAGAAAAPQPDALQNRSCSILNVTPAEAVLLAIACLEKVKVNSRCSACVLLQAATAVLLLRLGVTSTA